MDENITKPSNIIPKMEKKNVYRTFLSAMVSLLCKPQQILDKNYLIEDIESVNLGLDRHIIVNKNFKKKSVIRFSTVISHESIKRNLLNHMKLFSTRICILHDIESNKIGKENITHELKGLSHIEIKVVLLWAAFLKKWELLEDIIKLGAVVTYSEPVNGLTALHLAALSGCAFGTELLISKGSKVNAIEKWYSPLHCAALENQVETAKILLNNGAKVQSMTNGPIYETPLYSAVRVNAIECVRLFISQGAYIFQEGKLSDMSPLHLAAEKGHTECLRIMLETKDMNANLTTKEKGDTALHVATEQGHVKCVDILLDKGADANFTNNRKNGSAATKELLKGDPDAHNFQENTYKKITPCDVCSQILRGHTRQGLKCRICKMNVHLDCQKDAQKCQTKAKLLRRQKSTSEIETRLPDMNAEDERIKEGYSMPTINRRISVKSPEGNRLFPPNDTAFLESQITEVDQIYQVLKQATEISNSKARVNIEAPGITVERSAGSNPGSSGGSGQSLNKSARAGLTSQPSRVVSSNLAVINPAPCSTSSDLRRSRHGSTTQTTTTPPQDASSMRRRLFAGMKSLTGFGSRSRHGSPGNRSISLPETPHSPRRQKLNLRMKSLSLDSPESTEHVQRRQRHVANAASDPHSNQSSSSRIQFVASTVPPKSLPTHPVRKDLKTQSTPSSPVHNRRLLSAKNIRMSSVELPDENDKSPSSASTSPCPSPVGKKSQRLLPTNLYVVLYNFKSRHQDELDLKAGYKVTVIDTSDPDWWKGKCFGRMGFFPSKYVSKLSSGEKPLQVTHNLQVSDGDNGLMLLRDQIVIQIGEEVDGMVMIRSGDNRQGVCPVKFLQEV